MGKGQASEAAVAERSADGERELKQRKLVGYQNFVRNNPMSDKFEVHRFHHIEVWCGDATNAARRFSHALGMPMIRKSDQSTGNSVYSSYTLLSGELCFLFTSPYSSKCIVEDHAPPLPDYSIDKHWDFVKTHGLAVRAVGLSVSDAAAAYETSVANGGRGVLPPTRIADTATGTTQLVSEVELYGDVVLRFVSGEYKGVGLAGYEDVAVPEGFKTYGLKRLDHAVGNVPDLMKQVAYMEAVTGFHEFAEFTAADVGTVDSGLNSMVMANNNEFVLMPINEPTFGTKRKSQIQTYLEQNEGAGLQHLALMTDDILATMREMRAAGVTAGFDFMPRPSPEYYANLPAKIGDALNAEQYKEVEAQGLLADKDDQGVLLQIFTKPVGDRPTLFLEIIQRIGCMRPVEPAPVAATEPKIEQSAGCGGFGKGNFSELFKSIEEYEKTLDV